jgi:L-ascorbate metabolism protein UlaG (beta-lactamase superfamily)
MIEGITWFKQSSVRINRGGKTIYIDPWELKEHTPADFILITHEHFDHLSPPDIEKLRHDRTYLIAPKSLEDKVPNPTHLMNPGETLELDGVKIQGFPAYNTNKEFHPKENNWLAYRIEVDGRSYYHAGDTDLIPEMKDIQVDVAFLPIGGTYTMDWKEACEAVKRINSTVTIAFHFGDVVGDESDAKNLQRAYPEKIKILERGKEY